MFDIEFFQAAHALKTRSCPEQPRSYISLDLTERMLESWRNKLVPTVYNIETTNACNMKCKMCPRTTMMTRPVETMSTDLFVKLVDQLQPWTHDQWARWEDFVAREYSIMPNDMSENHFYLHIIPKVIQLHGYGAPLLDLAMTLRVSYLSKCGLLSYFSCNPANINVEKFRRIMAAGLDYVKFSIESVDDETHKEIRGPASNFTEAFDKIRQVINLKQCHEFKTTIVITMLNVQGERQRAEYQKLLSAFEGYDVYIYLKSQDQHWYDNSAQVTESIHWTEHCHHPWSSMTIKSDGKVAMCMEDFNNEIILGDAAVHPLRYIWNGPEYAQFRKSHCFKSPYSELKCYKECDMKTVGERE